MTTYLKFGANSRILLKTIVGVEVLDNQSDTFMHKFGIVIADDGMEEIVLHLKYGKNVSYRVKGELVADEMQRIYDALDWE